MKRSFAIGLVLALLIGVLAGCGPADAPGSSSPGGAEQPVASTNQPGTIKPTELVMWTFLNPNGGTSSRELALKEIIDNFEAANEGITVTVETIAFDQIPAKFFSADVAGNAPDIIWMSFREIGEAVRLGTLADLNTLFINDWTEAEVEDMADVYWNYAADDQARYQLTFVRSADMLAYRTDVFEAKGYAPPFKSWDEFITACQAVTEDTDGDDEVDIWGFGQQFGSTKPIGNVFVPSLVELQGGMFHDDGTPNWATDAGMKSARLATDMVTEHGITPDTSVSYSQEDLIEGFCAGKYGCITVAASRLPALRSTATFDPSVIQLAHFPSWSGDTFGSGILSGWGVGIWSKSEKAEPAGKFVEFMFNPQSEKIWVEVGLQVPFRKSTLAAMDDYFKKPENDFLVAMIEEFSTYGWTCPWQYPISGYDILQNEAQQRILLNNQEAREALAQAEQEFIKKNS